MLLFPHIDLRTQLVYDNMSGSFTFQLFFQVSDGRLVSFLLLLEPRLSFRIRFLQPTDQSSERSTDCNARQDANWTS